MSNDTFRTIQTAGEGLYKEKGSKFLSFAIHVQTPEEIRSVLESFRKTYYDARHICYAWILGPTSSETRANDDGEPSGTAGRPILGQIQSAGLTDVLVIVVRYFGGVLLGTGGLVTADKAAAADAIQAAVTEERTIDAEFRIRFEFPFMNEVMKLVKSLDVKIVSQDYNQDCGMFLRIRKGEAERLESALSKVETLRFEIDG